MNKTDFYLNELKKIKKEFESYGLKAVVGGGFAIDGYLEKITREHNDLDLDIVGDINWPTGFEKTKNILKKLYKDKLIVKNRRFEVNHQQLKIDFEYVKDLTHDEKFCYLFGDSSYEFPIPLYLFGGGKLDNLTFDIENPHFIFAIKYLMPISGEKKIREKDQVDIQNLITKLDKLNLITVLHFQLDYIKSRLRSDLIR